MTTSSFARETTVLETERLHTVPNLDVSDALHVLVSPTSEIVCNT